MVGELLGKSTQGQAIYLFRLGGGGPKRVLLMGGVHGNEPEGVVLAKQCLADFAGMDWDLEICILPTFNPDGLLKNQRTNANGVDLNRNLPTKDWSPEAFNKKYPPGSHANSEVENQILTTWLKENKPSLIMSFHSFEKTLMNINGECELVAEEMKSINGLPIETTMGYPTPGCLGTYAGFENEMPTITYEIFRGMSFEEIKNLHLPAVRRGLEHFQKNDLNKEKA